MQTFPLHPRLVDESTGNYPRYNYIHSKEKHKWLTFHQTSKYYNPDRCDKFQQHITIKREQRYPSKHTTKKHNLENRITRTQLRLNRAAISLLLLT